MQNSSEWKFKTGICLSEVVIELVCYHVLTILSSFDDQRLFNEAVARQKLILKVLSKNTEIQF
jgi:hypothetical protein